MDKVNCFMPTQRDSLNDFNSEHTVFFAYCDSNPLLKSNQVLANFFKETRHVSAFVAYVKEPVESNSQFLSTLFRIHFFNIRFVRYVSSLISFVSIDFHRMCRKRLARNQLIFDLPAGDKSDMSFGELLSFLKQKQNDVSRIQTTEQFRESIERIELSDAFGMLTAKQKEVITLAYAVGWLDSDIAHAFQVSQQAITKTRISALRKMRKHILQCGKGELHECTKN